MFIIFRDIVGGGSFFWGVFFFLLAIVWGIEIYLGYRVRDRDLSWPSYGGSDLSWLSYGGSKFMVAIV